MKYELINKYTIKQIKHCTRSMIIDGKIYSNIETSNPTDEILDELNIGMYLDETALMPVYDASTHYLQIYYSISDGKIIRDYEVLEIVPSDVEVISNKIDILKQRANATETTILDLLMDGGV